jgi:hypothetical protein
MDAYTYTVSKQDLATNYQHVWRRRADYVDEAIFQALKIKLEAAFEPTAWEVVSGSMGEDFKSELKQLHHQITSVTKQLAQITENYTHVSNPNVTTQR